MGGSGPSRVRSDFPARSTPSRAKGVDLGLKPPRPRRVPALAHPLPPQTTPFSKSLIQSTSGDAHSSPRLIPILTPLPANKKFEPLLRKHGPRGAQPFVRLNPLARPHQRPPRQVPLVRDGSPHPALARRSGRRTHRPLLQPPGLRRTAPTFHGWIAELETPSSPGCVARGVAR